MRWTKHGTREQGRSQEFATGGQKRGSSGQNPGGGHGSEVPRSRRHAEYSAEQSTKKFNTAKIVYCQNFQLRRGGGHDPMSPLGYATVRVGTADVTCCHGRRLLEVSTIVHSYSVSCRSTGSGQGTVEFYMRYWSEELQSSI